MVVVQVLETWTNLGPITDFCIKDIVIESSVTCVTSRNFTKQVMN